MIACFICTEKRKELLKMITRRFTKKDHVYKNPTINADSFDKRRFNELLHMSKGLQNIRHEGRNAPYFDQLMGDIWASFYKTNPRLLDDVPQELITNQNIMKRILSDKKYLETHEFTKLDDIHSSFATIGFSQKIFSWLEEQTDTNKDVQQAYREMMKKQRVNGEDSKEYKKALQEYFQQVQEQLESNSPDFSKMIADSVEESKQIQESITNIIGGIEAGIGSNNVLKNLPLKEVFDLAEYLKNNYQMKQIAYWAGRFKAIARTKQKNISKEAIARSGVTVGNDIDRMLPNELLNLSNPVTKVEFLKRFAEGQTLQYANRGKEALGQGPIIICLDQSGSMDKLDQQSKGFVLALISIAKRQKRNFALITFDKRVKIRKYNRGKISIGQMIELCNDFLGGGTDFQKPLDQSLNILRSEKFKNADIVFVTDGAAPIRHDFIDMFNGEKKKYGFSVLSLLIGNNSKRSTVSVFSDEIYHANDFEDRNAHEIFKI